MAMPRAVKYSKWLEEIGVTQICTEETEAAPELAVLLLREVGANQEDVQREIANYTSNSACVAVKAISRRDRLISCNEVLDGRPEPP